MKQGVALIIEVDNLAKNDKDFKSKGLKVTEKGNVFENGYLQILLDNGVMLSQYIMVIPIEGSLLVLYKCR